MFSRYEEISKIIRDYVDESLTKPMMSAKVLGEKIESLYDVRLSEVDLTNLANKISSAKKCREDYNAGVRNKAYSETDWNNALDKAKDLAVQREGEARAYGADLAVKVCIMMYKGPLTSDTMAELKKNGYDGTYGSATMIQMYAFYIENQRLREETAKKDVEITDQKNKLNQYQMTYTQQFQQLKSYETQNTDLVSANEALRTSNSQLMERLNAQGEVMQTLSDRIDQLSKKFSVQLLETLREFFGKEKEDTNKTMH